MERGARKARRKQISAGSAGSALHRRLLFHGRADQIAPLGPRAVVVLHVRETQEMLEGEPGEARSLADAAVRDDRLIARDALRGVQRLQVVKALEGAIVIAVLPPRNALRAGNVSAALARLGQS